MKISETGSHVNTDADLIRRGPHNNDRPPRGGKNKRYGYPYENGGHHDL